MMQGVVNTVVDVEQTGLDSVFFSCVILAECRLPISSYQCCIA